MLQWEDLGASIIGHHAERFGNLLDNLWDSEVPADRVRAAELFLRTLDYFKPRLARVQVKEEAVRIPPLVAVDGVVRIPPNWPGQVVEINSPLKASDVMVAGDTIMIDDIQPMPAQ